MRQRDKPPAFGIRLPVLTGLAALALLIAGGAIWSMKAQISSAAIASGVLGSVADRHILQHPTGGVIAEIRAKEGLDVEAGELLLRFDSEPENAALTVLQAQATVLCARIGALIAERDGLAAPVYTADPTSEEEQAARAEQTNILNARNVFYAEAERLAGDRGAAHEARISALERERAALFAQKTTLVTEVADMTTLVEKGLAQTGVLRAWEREAQTVELQIGEADAAIASMQLAIANIRAETLQAKSARFETTVSGLVEAELRLAELIERIDEIERQIAQKSLHAPVSGIVHMLAVHEAAAVVAGGEDILQIIPSKSSGIASVRISPMDIEAVHEGMTASLRLTGLNQRKTAELRGEVVRVSADIFTDEASQSSYYIAEIRIDPQDWAGLEGLNVKPGMPVQSFMHTGDQAPIAYLIGPLLDYMSGAFRTR